MRGGRHRALRRRADDVPPTGHAPERLGLPSHMRAEHPLVAGEEGASQSVGERPDALGPDPIPRRLPQQVLLAVDDEEGRPAFVCGVTRRRRARHAVAATATSHTDGV